MEKKYLIIYDNQGREMSRFSVPNFVIPALEHMWAMRLFSSRRKQDKRADHWNIIKIKQQ